MPFVPAICTQCGSPIQVDDTKEAGICPHCGTAFITEKVVNNYVTNHVSNTNVTQTIVKNVYGREKTEAEEYVARGLSYLGLGKYLKAAKCFKSAVDREPGNIENHILLYRALTADFCLYYGGIVDPENDTNKFGCDLSSNDNSFNQVTLNEVFENIEKLAEKADMPALQKKYGFSFRKDKDFWLKSYRIAVKCIKDVLAGRQNEILNKLTKAYDHHPPSSVSTWFSYFPFPASIAYAIDNLHDCPDFTQEERDALFQEYIRDFTIHAKDCETPILIVYSYKIFPERDGYFDLTAFDGAIFLADELSKKRYDLRWSGKNLGTDCPPGWFDVIFRSLSGRKRHYQPIYANNCRISHIGVLKGFELHADRLLLEEGITSVCGTNIYFRELTLPDSLEEIDAIFHSCYFDEANRCASIRFGKGLKRIRDCAFRQQNDVYFNEPLVLPKGLEEIGAAAFAPVYCQKGAVLPASLKKAGEIIFGNKMISPVVCLFNTKKIKKWNLYYDENGNLDGKQMSSYNYLSVQKKTYFSSQPLTDAFISEKKKELECFQEYITFDIQKIKFKRAKSYGVCYIS